MNKETKKILQWIGIAFLIWRVVLILIAYAGKNLIPLREGYLGESIWANFDGVHYLTIAERGYLSFQQAFFPFYPFLIRYIARHLNNYLLSGMLLSHLVFLVALFLFYKLIRLDFSEKVGKRSLLYLLLFPTSFYFGSVYTESLFLALILGSFYAARKKQWFIAGILGAFASATRFVGIFLFPALLLEWHQQNGARKKPAKGWSAPGGKNLKSLLSLFLIIFGLLFYMWYLERTIGDPLYFIHVQPFFGAERTGGKVILLYQVFWRYFKMLVTVEKMTPTYFVVVLEFLSSLLFLALSLIVFLRFRLSYFVFMVLAYLTPTFTGTFSSLPRYVLTLFPGFIALALLTEKYRWLRIFYPILAGIILIASVILFTRGYFIA